MPLSFAQHAVHPWFEHRDDVLVIAGQPLTDIAARVGRTPFYVYDRSVMTRKARGAAPAAAARGAHPLRHQSEPDA